MKKYIIFSVLLAAACLLWQCKSGSSDDPQPNNSPTIVSFTPTSGGIGATVTITGTNFSTTAASNVVKFNGVNATVTSATATSITTTVPTGATTGKIAIEVAGKTATSASDFTVSVNATHTITSFSPASAGQGGEITLIGTNFPTERTQIEVRVGNNSTMVNPWNATATQIKFFVPFQATTGKISIKVGTTTVNSATDLTITPTPAPVITSISAASVLAKRGIVLIDGTNLSRTAPNAPEPKYYM